MALPDAGQLLVALAGVFAAAALLANAPSFFAAAFRPVADPGWPHGVQEDDDLQWTWRGDGPAPASGPDVGVDDEYRADPCPVEPRIGPSTAR